MLLHQVFPITFHAASNTIQEMFFSTTERFGQPQLVLIYRDQDYLHTCGHCVVVHEAALQLTGGLDRLALSCCLSLVSSTNVCPPLSLYKKKNNLHQ